MTRILIVDDEPQILRALRITLQARHYEVVAACDGTRAIAAVETDHPDVVVLDLGLPDIDGVHVIRALRAWTPVPVIVLSGRRSSTDKIDALDAGADDYVTKPFDIGELLARLRAVTRRHGPADEPAQARIGRYTVDLTTRDARHDDGRRRHLTRTEWRLLELLVHQPGRLISHRDLLRHGWGPTYVNEVHYLRQFVAQLRRKLEDDPARPRHLLTEPGMGYRFQP
ncbi:response regulator [Dactylosporangium sp. NPDC050688]|uniref:response regulator n=1 Tax=Dactylosporangium sp. NPDC050688 TaxID=3157217 RepID=UPI0033F00035